jgi:DNA-binding NarL/FixJ family response regulator
MATPLVTKILIADDHGLVREGLKHVLNAAPDLEVVAEAADGVEAVELALAHDVDLAVLDLSMPRMTGLQAARDLARHRPEVRVVVLSMYDNEEFLFDALKAGAAGYVLKAAAADDIVEACRSAMRGEPFLYPSAVKSLVRDFVERGGTEPELLTRREIEVLKLVAEGKSSKEIADDLVLSVKTVERHRGDILHRLGMRDRVDLTRYAIRRGLIQP